MEAVGPERLHFDWYILILKAFREFRLAVLNLPNVSTL